MVGPIQVFRNSTSRIRVSHQCLQLSMLQGVVCVVLLLCAGVLGDENTSTHSTITHLTTQNFDSTIKVTVAICDSDLISASGRRLVTQLLCNMVYMEVDTLRNVI